MNHSIVKNQQDSSKSETKKRVILPQSQIHGAGGRTVTKLPPGLSLTKPPGATNMVLPRAGAGVSNLLRPGVGGVGNMGFGVFRGMPGMKNRAGIGGLQRAPLQGTLAGVAPGSRPGIMPLSRAPGAGGAAAVGPGAGIGSLRGPGVAVGPGAGSMRGPVGSGAGGLFGDKKEKEKPKPLPHQFQKKVDDDDEDLDDYAGG